MKLISKISRILIGAVFIFSGFVKAIDPLGYTYKITDYFEAFHIDFLSVFSFTIAVCISAFELLIGLCLILRIRMRQTAWVLSGFMVFFTILTFVIALTNPVTDCGCFGDALILTNWQTFFKNILFLIPTAIVLWQRNNYDTRFGVVGEWAIVIGLFLIGVFISIHGYRNLPVIDFRPYEIGTYIPAAMELPEGAPVDEYETTMVYEKDGVQKEFAIEEIPWQDTTWKYVDRKTVLIKKGEEPPIHDFSLTAADGYEVTDDMLYDPDYSLLLVSYRVEKSSVKGWKNIKAFTDSLTAPVKVYAMTSSLEQDVEELKNKTGIDYDFYTTDEITLKTMVRSNPGVILIKDGTVIGKWHYTNVPVKGFEDENLLSESLKYLNGKKEGLVIIGFFLFLAILIIVVEFSTIKI